MTHLVGKPLKYEWRQFPNLCHDMVDYGHPLQTDLAPVLCTST